MAVNKPKGDNARKGAVKKRGRKPKRHWAARAHGRSATKTRASHGPETARQKGRQKIQVVRVDRAAANKRTAKKTTKKKSRAR
jgi:hypothetical protein